MTGIPPSVLLEDEQLYAAAIEQAEQAEWSNLHELLARNVELTHAVMCQLRANSGAKHGDIPPPLRIPRPGEKAEDRSDVIVMKPHELAAAIVRGNV